MLRKKIFYSFLLLSLVAGCVGTSKQKEVPLVEENWESMATHEKEPEWFIDSKLGIYFHWGVYSVPAYGSEWYPRWMYVPNRKGWGGDIYKHHVETYGNPSEFNYHEFVPMFKAEHFDPADWADLFQQAGAKFAGPVAQHHDGFAMWDSELNPWNSSDKGPQKDILGDLFKELKARDMHTIATFHHARNLQRHSADSSEWGGSKSHFPYHPDYATSTQDAELKYLYGNIPEAEFNEYWLGQVNEVVDNYEPDIIWFDSWLDEIPETYRQKMVAHHFNAAAKRGVESVVCYKQKDLPRNVGVLDIEQGGMKEMSPDYWMTDITISTRSWCYIQDQKYKDAALVIRNMIDVWSKKGIVLLNISPMANGVIPDEQRLVLADIGDWLNVFGEAVYGSRAYSVFGYGNAEIHEGHFGGQSATIEYSADDIRFTQSKDGKSVYVFLLGMPKENTALRIKHIVDTNEQKIKKISMLGDKSKMVWSVEGDVLIIETPGAEKMNEIATVFKVDLR